MYKIKLDSISKDNIIDFINESELDIEISYLSDFVNTKKLRDIISIICSILKVDKNDVYKIVLIIDEMNNNAIEYGSKSGDCNKIRILTRKNKNNIKLNIEVEDSGSGPKVHSASNMEKLKKRQLKEGYLKHHSIRGRGLFLIIINLVDKLYFKDSNSGGLVVGIEKELEV